jgi:hypothetical protein
LLLSYASTCLCHVVWRPGQSVTVPSPTVAWAPYHQHAKTRGPIDPRKASSRSRRGKANSQPDRMPACAALLVHWHGCSILIAERVYNFLAERVPLAFCDDCIAERLELSRRQQAHRITTALGTTSNFHREDGTCSLCGETRKVIRHAYLDRPAAPQDRVGDVAHVTPPGSASFTAPMMGMTFLRSRRSISGLLRSAALSGSARYASMRPATVSRGSSPPSTWPRASSTFPWRDRSRSLRVPVCRRAAMFSFLAHRARSIRFDPSWPASVDLSRLSALERSAAQGPPEVPTDRLEFSQLTNATSMPCLGPGPNGPF